jgi:RNA polymerase sigma-70 factor (ECF subfamily)
MLSEKNIPDEKLISAIKRRNSRAFALLVSKYQLKVKSLGLSFFRNSTDAEDFVQDVFIKVYTCIDSFRGDSQFSTWLMRIAYNTAINSVKRAKDYLPLNEGFEIEDSGLNPEEKQLRKLTVQAVQETLKEIPEKFAVCLDLYFFYDFSYIDISEMLDLPINTVKSHIFRAKKLMKSKLEAVL